MMPSTLSRLTPLLALYGSRMAGVLVSLLFIPFFARSLGSEQFGLVALVLSIQAMLITLDLGMSALLGRDIAAADSNRPPALLQWRQAERLLSTAMLVLAGLVLTAVAALAPAHLADSLLAMILFWAVLLQNLSQAAMLARRAYQQAGAIQIIGVLGRAGLTALALSWVQASFSAFLLTQVLGALAHLAANRHYCKQWLGADKLEIGATSARAPETLTHLFRRGLPLFITGLAGALVTQLDKSIVALFMGPSTVSPYFLATTFSMLPIALLAMPVAQFFQPHIVRSCSDGDAPALLCHTRRLSAALVAAVIVPTCLIWAARDPLIMLWLHDEALAARVAELVAVLLPAAALGAIGTIPLALLSGLQDFKFQARLSTALAIGTLACVLIFASEGSLIAVCWAYLGYYVSLTASLWLRAASSSVSVAAARQSALIAGLAGLVALPPTAFLAGR